MAFKMKGHTLPGIKQSKEGKMADGRAKSSALQFGLPDPLNLFGGKKNNCPPAGARPAAVPGQKPPPPAGPAPTTPAPAAAVAAPAVAEEAVPTMMKKKLKVGAPKLVGKQKNIDKNKNGKIDAGDFKAMKNGPTKKSKY